MYRYFEDRESLIHAAALEAIRRLNEAIEQAAPEHGPPLDAIRRLLAGLIQVSDQIVFLFNDPGVLENIPKSEQPDRGPVLKLIKRGQRDGTFDNELAPEWIVIALLGLVSRASRAVVEGEMPRHSVVGSVTRIFERGVVASASPK